MNEHGNAIKSERVRRGWMTRRGAGYGECAKCRAVGRLYRVAPVHPVRDLCLNCAWQLGGASSDARGLA